MKIGLIFPNKDRKDKTVHIGLGYLASYARKEHHDTVFSILDTRISTEKEIRKFLNSDFGLIGLTVLSPVFYEVAGLVKKIRIIAPYTPIIAGGPYVTTMMEEIFDGLDIDYAVYGEGEVTFSEFISFLKKERSIETIDGLIYRNAENIIVKNPPRKQIKDLDSIPFPAYDLFKMNRYPMHRITTTRGCPYKCVFCNSSSIWDWKWRKRSVENIVEEIQYLLKNYGKKVFFLNDNTFNVDLERIELFCKTLIEKKINILWSTPVKVEIITPEVATLMKKAGCYNVGIGIESANNEILKNIRKNTTIEDIDKGIAVFKKAGIEVLGQFVIGSPGDTLETVKESIDYAKRSALDFIMFYSILPFRGTEQWDYAVKNGNFPMRRIHEFHSISPRIVFETPEFPYNDRLEAIRLAKSAGYYSESNNRSYFFDFGKETARKIQAYLPSFISDRLYIFMKNFYRKRLLNKDLKLSGYHKELSAESTENKLNKTSMTGWPPDWQEICNNDFRLLPSTVADTLNQAKTQSCPENNAGQKALQHASEIYQENPVH